MDEANRLIEQLVSDPEARDLEAPVLQLLAHYHRGGAVETLRALLQSPNERLVGEGAWIASELGDSGQPLLHDIGKILGHRSKKARFWSLDCVLLWAGLSNGYELAVALSLVDDPEEAVRWKAMSFLSMASSQQLEAAYAEIEARSSESPYVEELKWLLGPGATDSSHIISRLDDHHSRRRRFGVAAAFRIAKDDDKPLRYAASLGDHEIAQFARDMLERIRGQSDTWT